MKDKIEVIPEMGTNLLKIGNKYYLKKKEYTKKNGHISKIVYEKINLTDYKKSIKKLVKDILKKGDIDREDILIQALAELPSTQINKLKSLLKGGTKPKIGKGCLYINIGGIEIPIINNADLC